MNNLWATRVSVYGWFLASIRVVVWLCICVSVGAQCVKRHDDLLGLSVTGIFELSCLPRNSRGFSMETDLHVTF